MERKKLWNLLNKFGEYGVPYESAKRKDIFNFLWEIDYEELIEAVNNCESVNVEELKVKQEQRLKQEEGKIWPKRPNYWWRIDFSKSLDIKHEKTINETEYKCYIEKPAKFNFGNAYGLISGMYFKNDGGLYVEFSTGVRTQSKISLTGYNLYNEYIESTFKTLNVDNIPTKEELQKLLYNELIENLKINKLKWSKIQKNY